MGIIMLLFGIGAVCLVVWKALTYAVPGYLGFTVTFWSLAHGAGAAALLAGLLVAGTAIAAARLGMQSKQTSVRFMTAIVMIVPAGYVGYCAANEIAPVVSASHTWQTLVAALAALCVAITAFLRLQERQVL